MRSFRRAAVACARKSSACTLKKQYVCVHIPPTVTSKKKEEKANQDQSQSSSTSAIEEAGKTVNQYFSGYSNTSGQPDTKEPKSSTSENTNTSPVMTSIEDAGKAINRYFKEYSNTNIQPEIKEVKGSTSQSPPTETASTYSSIEEAGRAASQYFASASSPEPKPNPHSKEVTASNESTLKKDSSTSQSDTTDTSYSLENATKAANQYYDDFQKKIEDAQKPTYAGGPINWYIERKFGKTAGWFTSQTTVGRMMVRAAVIVSAKRLMAAALAGMFTLCEIFIYYEQVHEAFIRLTSRSSSGQQPVPQAESTQEQE
eukprot:TRINITY_DN15162_c0_g2_i1.p1 TRINITY_DN15162_c0_g2~~TRINITY_DN15162_c0_g2_i1.p1  ORF type:complete len:315 (+),score=62.44 TRINITY_DN15162_c0_g2_i1:40-984(+)